MNKSLDRSADLTIEIKLHYYNKPYQKTVLMDPSVHARQSAHVDTMQYENCHNT